MRDFTSCFSENAVKVADYACSGSASSKITSNNLVKPSVQTSVTNIYRSKLTSGKELHITVTWSWRNFSPLVSLVISDELQLLKKKKGSSCFVSGTSMIGIHWDISMAKYESGPEPVKDFYVVVSCNAEIALLIGDMSKEYANKFGDSALVAAFSVVRRTEHVLGQNLLFTSKSCFSNGGIEHEISIRCKGEGGDSYEPELLVFIDKKRMVHERGLKLKFRGNHTVFVDGLPVDIMWDLHDWFFSIPSGCATFTFRQRSSLGSRLWLEEEMMEREQGNPRFCLLIQAFKSL